MTSRTVRILLLNLFATSLVLAQPKPEPDQLLLKDGEKLLGHLKSATTASLIFTSDMVGDLTIEWSKIQELRTSGKFAVIPKGVTLAKPDGVGRVPRGTVVVTDQKIEVSATPPSPEQTVPVGNVANVVDLPSFEGASRPRSILRGWRGTGTAGFSLSEATQNNRTFSAAVNLVRAVPSESWLEQRNRTIFDFNDAYGLLTQPGTPSIKTSLYHFDLEQDRYVSPRVFAFVNAALDHSFSQGLHLQQTYGGGIGLVVVKSDAQEFDVKASANYVRQQFISGDNNQSLIGSVFGETYTRKLPLGVALKEQGGFTPAWNNTRAYSAFTSLALTLPTYHHLGVSFGLLDNFLNDPPVGFKKNSFQVTAGATYTFQ